MAYNVDRAVHVFVIETGTEKVVIPNAPFGNIRLEAYPTSRQFGEHVVLQNTGFQAAPTSSGLRTLVVCGALLLTTGPSLTTGLREFSVARATELYRLYSIFRRLAPNRASECPFLRKFLTDTLWATILGEVGMCAIGEVPLPSRF